MHGGEFRIVKPLSKGGMGALYLAVQTLAGTERPCVIKGMLDYVDPTDSEAVRKARQRFQKEAATLVELNHVGIPQIYDYFAEGGRNYIVMAYIEGENLQERLERSGPQKSEEIARYGIQLCEILEYLASLTRPVVHHDIKPANIIIDKNTGTVRLVDFGTAKARLTLEPGGKVGLRKSSIYGTAGYAPPEQYQGQSTPKSDVYALAATMYHLLTDDDPGDHPFSFPRLSQVQSILGQALEPDSNKRISATELREALEKWLQSPRKPKPKPQPQTNNFRVVLPAVPDGKVPETVQALVRVLKTSEQQATLWAYSAPQAVLKTTFHAEASRVAAQLTAAGIVAKMIPVDESRLQLPTHLERDLLDKGYAPNLVILRLGADRRCHCYICGHEWTSRRPAGGPPPGICPKCKAKEWSRHRLFKCRVCDHEFAHGDQSRSPQQLFPACPACGTTNWLPGRAPVLELKGEKKINLGTLLLCQSTSITVNVSRAGEGDLRRIVSRLMPAPSSAINVSNAGGGNLRGIIRCRESWLQIEQPFKGSGKFTITIDPHQLKGGKSYRGVIEVISNGGTTEVKVELFTRTPEPADLVSLSDKHWTKARSYLYAGKFAEWLEARNRSDLANEVKTIRQRGGDQDVGLEELLHVLAPKLPQPILRFSTKALDFGAIDPGQQKALNLNLANAGRGCLLVSLQPRQPWLKVRPDSVKILAGRSQPVIVELHGGQLSPRPRITGQIDVRDQFNRLDCLEAQATIPLAFRSGEVARSTSELVHLCDEYWTEARDYLYDGTFEHSFQALKWGDVAAGAEAIRQRGGDQDVGLEKFLQSLVPKPPLPTWQMNPTVLNFEVTKARRKPLSLGLENSGRGCALIAMQSTSHAFTAQPGSVKLLPGQSQKVKVELDVDQLMARPGPRLELELKDQFGHLRYVQLGIRLVPEDLPALCEQYWAEARRCLQDGTFARWLQASDHQRLAEVAQSPQKADDPDSHLDQFLRVIDPTRVPRLISNVVELDFGTLSQGQRKTMVLEVSNGGNGLLDGQVDCAPDDTWLSVNPTVFRCFPGQKQQIEVTIDTTRLTRQQTHQAQLTIASNGGMLSVPVKVAVPAKPPTLMVEPPHLDFGAVGVRSEIAPLALDVTNAGDGSLAVAVRTDQDWIQVTPQSFRSISGDAVEQIQVSLDAKRLKSRTSYSGYVGVASPGNGLWVPVYVRTLPTRWQRFTNRMRTTMQHAATGLLAGSLAGLIAWVWGQLLTLILLGEGSGDMLRDLLAASGVVCALVVFGFALRATRNVVASFLAGALGAGLGIGVVLVGLVAGKLPPTELAIGGAVVGLLAGIAGGLTWKT